jgi:glycosyltransferase involved in cell wall biosynthesis
MFVKNSFEYDARVTKEAKTLRAAGHDVTVVAIHVPGVTAERETTPDGIDVVRVSRMSFGMRFAQRVHARYVVGVEERHAALSGEEVDEDRVRKYTAVLPASTATPGDDGGRAPTPRRAPGPVERPTGARALWVRGSTAVLRAGSRLARWGFRAARFVFIWPLRATKTLAINRRFAAAGLETGADVWHCHDLNTLYAGARCKAKRPGTTLVYDSHELATQRSRMGRLRRWWAGWNERRGLRHVDEMIMTTRSRAQYQVDRYGIRFPTLIRNVPELIAIEQGWDLHERLDIPPDRRILLYQGSIQEFRGIEESIEAVTMLDRCVLVIIGYGYHRPALEASVIDRGLTDVVKFFGPIPNDELLYYTASADVGLCVIRGESLSYRWSLPNKLFEYMMAGIPVVASDYEEMGRVVREEGVGTVCDPADAASIAAAVRAIIDDPAAGAGFRAKTREAITRYNWAVEERTLLEMYERLTG